MHRVTYLRSRPPLLATGCALAATAAGITYMTAAGAPWAYLAINAGALAIGLAAARVVIVSMRVGDARMSGAVMLALGSALLATALFGVSVEGASRWVRLGGSSIQPALMIVPVMVMAFAGRNGTLATLGVIVAAFALALQPDRAMSGALAVGLGAVAVARPDRSAVVSMTAALAGFATTLVRTDALPAVPYVDGILYTSFGVHPLAGAAVLGGVTSLIVPAVVGLFHNTAARGSYAAFGAVWLAVTVAAALGNYPTPLVGYGASAIIGYALSLALLPGRIGGSATQPLRPYRPIDGKHDRHLREAVA